MIMTPKQLIKFLLPWIFLIILLIYIISTDNMANVVDALRNINPIFLFISLVLIIGYWISEASILRILLKDAAEKLSFKRILSITLAGQFFNGITPFASGGQPAQLYLLHKYKVSVGKGASVLTKKFIAYQAALVLYGSAVLLFMSGFFKEHISNFIYLGIIGFLVNLAVILMLVLVAVSPRTIKKIIISITRALRKRMNYLRVTRKSIGIIRSVDLFHTHMKDAGKEMGSLGIAFTLSLVQLTLFFLIPITIGLGFQLTFSSLLNVIGASAFVSMVTAFIPLPGAAIGAEGSFYMVFRIFYPANIIITALLLWRVITYYLPIAIGGIVVIADGGK